MKILVFIMFVTINLYAFAESNPVYIQNYSSNPNLIKHAIEANKLSDNYMGSLVYSLPNNQVLIKYLNKSNFGFTYYSATINASELENINRIDEIAANTLEETIPNSTSLKTISTDNTCQDNNAVVIVVSPYAKTSATDVIAEITQNDLLRIATEIAHKGYDVEVLDGQKANVSSFLEYLHCSTLRGVFYVGHGEPNGITLYASPTSSTMVELTGQDIRKAKLKGVLSSKIIEFNACNTFNGDLKQSFVDAGVKNYIAGKTYLTVPSSDNASQLFWVNLIQGEQVQNSLNNGIDKMDPNYFVHQIGDMVKIDAWGSYGDTTNTLF